MRAHNSNCNLHLNTTTIDSFLALDIVHVPRPFHWPLTPPTSSTCLMMVRPSGSSCQGSDGAFTMCTHLPGTLTHFLILPLSHPAAAPPP